uniref:Uncharacterized protein n=1 Tax=Arundo donax TaxID=35708 RepID=A0A0A9A864_ARUDO
MARIVCVELKPEFMKRKENDSVILNAFYCTSTTNYKAVK